MKIIHLSDTHFGNKQSAFDLEKLKNAINEYSNIFENNDTYFVVSGDITFKGNVEGYAQAKQFFNDTWLNNKGNRKRFLACPGNHDICNNSFNSFDSFLYGIRREHDTEFSKNSHGLVKFDNVAFLIVNSADHMDHEYGFINYDSLKKFLDSEQDYLKTVQQRIVIVHHHLIGVYKNDTSTIRNALPFIALLDEFKFNLILHGHQHSQMSMLVGNSKMEIFSSRSFNYPSSNLVNGINLFSYTQDRWQQKVLVLSEDNSMTNGLSFNKMEH